MYENRETIENLPEGLDTDTLEGVERDEPGENPYPELGSLKAQNKAGVGVFATDENDEFGDAADEKPPFSLSDAFANMRAGRCVCGKPLGHGFDTDTEDPEEAGAGDPDVTRRLEEALEKAFGAVFPGAGITVMRGDQEDTGPYYSVEDLTLIDLSLRFVFATLKSIDMMRAGNGGPNAATAEATRILGEIKTLVGTGSFGYDTIKTTGQNTEELREAMRAGRTSGVYVAPM